jgi:hypothetical protein
VECSDGRLDVSGLVGADVDLADQPVFEGRNHLIAQDGAEPIWPLHPVVTGAGWQLGRPFTDTPDPDHPARTAFPPSAASQATAEDLLRRFGVPLAADAPAFVNDSRRMLQAAADASSDPVEKDSLLRQAQLLVIVAAQWMQWRADLTGTPLIAAPGHGADELDPRAAWKVELLSTGFCSDSMCALVTGYLHLPLRDEVLDDTVWKLPGPSS